MSGGVVRLTIDGRVVDVPAGISVAAALAHAGGCAVRHSVRGEPRAPLCGMGICFECCATVDGRALVRTCMARVRDGMEVRRDG